MDKVVSPFRAADIQEIALSETAKRHFSSIAPMSVIAQEYELRGPAWTLRVDGNIVGCGGVMLLWSGVGEAWVMPNALAAEYPLACFRTICQGLQHAITAHNLRRVQSVVHESVPAEQRWVVRLGFEFEGVMRGYGPGGETYLRYALLVGGVIHG